VTAVPVELGVFLVFKSEQEHQTFVSERTKRNIDWEALSYRLYPRKERKAKIQVYESNKSIFDDFWSKMISLGRIPTENEYPKLQIISDLAGSPRRARTLFIDKFGIETLEEAFRMRKNDMLVYMALANFKSAVPFKDMSEELQIDIKTFLGGYKVGQETSRELLYSIADSELIARLCDETQFGYCDNQALYIHQSLLSSLHPVLRIYVGCASIFYGDLANMDIIKIHKRTGKVSLQKYDNFIKKTFPQLVIRVKVDLRHRKIDVFDHALGGHQQLLYHKYRYMRQDFPEYKKWKQMSDKVELLGLDTTGYGPTKQEFMAFLDEHGLTTSLRKKRSRD